MLKYYIPKNVPIVFYSTASTPLIGFNVVTEQDCMLDPNKWKCFVDYYDPLDTTSKLRDKTFLRFPISSGNNTYWCVINYQYVLQYE